jgi:hypothetical protein
VNEAPYSWNTKNAAGQQLTIRGNTYQEFAQNLEQVFGDGGANNILASYASSGAPAAQQQQYQQPAPAAAPAAGQPPAQAGAAVCPQCGAGHLVTKLRKDGKGSFVGCDNYPACNYIVRG